METTNLNQNEQQPAEDKTVAVLSYITLIGFIIAIILHGNTKTKIGAYHLRQASGLIIFAVGTWISLMVIGFIPVFGFIVLLLAPVLWIAILALLILGIINASNGEMKPLPLVGPVFEKWFENAFN